MIQTAPGDRARPPAGLATEEALRRLAEEGPNEVPGAPPVPAIRRFLRQFGSPLVYVLLAALAFDLGKWVHGGSRGWPLEAVVIAAILLFNAILGAAQEARSERALEGLRRLARPAAWVLRDGAWARVPGRDLVRGDLVRVEAGERVPADGTVRSGRGLLVDEAILTGESLPVERPAGDEVRSGTLAVRGSGLVVVSRTGAGSALGRIAASVGAMETTETPLGRRLDAFGRRVTRWVLLLGAALVTAGLLAEGPGAFAPILVFAAALAVSVVPEGLPAVVTLTLALGVQRMARRNAVVRRLQAVEALGSVTVIATDKTGTLTANRLRVHALESPDEAAALLAMIHANDADPGAGAGDPVDRALLDFAASRGVDPAAARRVRRRIAGRPFDSAWKFQRATVEGEGRRTSFLKGAPEVLLRRSALPPGERARWEARSASLATGGFRVLGLASADGESEEGLKFLGLVPLRDPPRPGAAESVAAARRAGVRVVMITGDHPETALAVAREVGIAPPGGGSVVMGADLDRMGRGELLRTAASAEVFARVDPHHKLALVEALRASGGIVAVTGDGVNDAPALKRADVGVAMGMRGSDVAREVSDLVLLDDDLGTIVAAIEEGRGIHASIRRFLRFLFATNAAEAAVILGGTAAAWAMGMRDAAGGLLVPLTASQILWVNLVTDGPPALALGRDRGDGPVTGPPPAPGAPLLDGPSLRFVGAVGLLVAGLAGLLLGALPATGSTVEETRTAVFLFLTVAQLAIVYPARRVGARPASNPLLHAAVAGGAVLQVATVLLPPLRRLLGLVPLAPPAWVAVLAGVVLAWAGAEAVARRVSDTPSRGEAVR
jgi:Ca2+-transporting ATPase